MSRTREASGASTPCVPNTTSVQVAVRIRPVTSADQSNIPPRWQKSILTASSANSVTVEPGSAPPAGPGAASSSSSALTRDKRQAFSFDRVFSPADGQSEIFTVAEPLIDRFMEGYNVTILAYGQTSSGKSYTMGTSAGDEVDYESLVAGRSADPQMGIIPRAVARIFSSMRQNKASGTQYSAKVSFIEIYNEDLIDLLGDAADSEARPHVQIREGKNGQIIWSGLREVKVANVAEVMNYLLQGSSVRRTNETDMNAQSSRSHAIFSMTLTQKKWVGSGPPPNAAPPSSFGGRSTPAGRAVSSISRASGIPMAGRVASPSFGRRTPSAIPALGGRSSSIGLRPASAMAGEAGDESTSSASVDGEWLTVTSKFHFVDLAGSERLKRTAAQGDRVKEGISINSGLHALGNVISALGDPAKAKRATHIPYRDSKLTRLLQDSLGGNAHTLMIACVSPTEYNVSETVNTLQYANRARNIKNKAELNEVEVGWDDVDYLQTLVQRLRKELSLIKGVGKGSIDLDDPRNKDATRTTQREILVWQDKYASLSQKHSQLTAQVTQLRTQLDPSKSDGSEQDFFRAAEPIIVEYEKSIDALEGQLNLTKAALAHVEDIANEREAQIEQQSSQLEIIGGELEEKEATVAELQSRLNKLQERESSAEVYARELEQRLEAVGTRGDTDSAVLAELQKEIARLKEVETSSEQYIRDLEAKLASSEESATSLTRKVAQMEAEIEKRDEDYRNLLSRFELLDNGKETQAIAAELEARNVEVQNLETRLADATAKHDSLASRFDSLTAQHEKLAQVSDGHEQEKQSLADKIKQLQVAAAAGVAAGGVRGALLGAAVRSNGDNSSQNVAERAATDESNPAATAAEAEASTKELEERLTNLQEEMRAVRDSESSIRAELELTKQKYKESLSEINDLNSQLTEIKLNGGVSAHLEPDSFKLDKDDGDNDDEQLEVLDSQGDENRPPGTPQRAGNHQRNLTNRGRPGSLLIDTTNRQTPSPSSNRLTRRSSGSFLGYNKSDGTRSAGISPLAHGRTRSISQSSSLDFASALPSQLTQTGRGPRPLSLTGSVPPSPTLKAFEPDSAANYERKVASLEKETMRLQEALKERDEELRALETTLRSRRQSMVAGASPLKAEHGGSSTDTVTAREGELDQTLLVPAIGAGANGVESGALTPATEKDLEAIRRLMAENAAGGASTDSNGTQMLDDLMRSMARKETQHRETVESMSAELTSLRKQNETLETLSRDQMANMSQEIEELRAQLAAAKTTGSDMTRSGSSGRSLADELNAASVAEQEDASAAAQAQLEQLKAEHASNVDALKQEHEKSLQQLAAQHAEALSKVQVSRAAAVATSRSIPGGFGADEDEDAAIDHSKALSDAQEEHARQLTKLKEEADASLSKALAVQAAQHENAIAEHTAKLASRDVESKQMLEATKAEHATQLEALRGSHAKSLQELKMELEAQHLSALSVAVREAEAAAAAKHAAELEKLDQERSGSATEAEEQLAAVKAEHAGILEKVKSEHGAKLERAMLDLEIVNGDRDATRQAYEELHVKHQDLLSKADIDPHEVETLRAELNDTSDALVTLEAALTETQEERDQLLIEIETIRQEAEAQQQDASIVSNGSALRNAAAPSPADATLKRELESHKSMLSKTRGDMTKLKAELQAARDECTRHEQSVKELQMRLATSETRSVRSHGSGSGSFGQQSQSEHDAASAAASLTNGARSPNNGRRVSDYEPATIDLRSHRPSLGAVKPPPPTPPPNMPPPPTPAGATDRSASASGSMIRTSAGVRTSTSSAMTRPESPGNVGAGMMTRSSSMTSVHSPAGHMMGNGMSGGADVKLTRLVSEQAEEIKNLAKQLNHCEADLQANIDLVATLEAALNDSERNLRKSRVQLAEVTREKERYAAEANAMRAQLNTAQSEVENVRNSVMLEKQGYESKIEEERQAKERARKALEARLEEVSKRKSNKLFCL